MGHRNIAIDQEIEQWGREIPENNIIGMIFLFLILELNKHYLGLNIVLFWTNYLLEPV